MKKKISCVILLLGICSTSHAAIFKLGPRLGVSTSTLQLDDNAKEIYKPEFGWGYQGGVVGRIDLPIIYIQPELLVTGSGAVYNFENKKYILRYIKLNAPIMVGIKFMGIFRLQLGPTLNFLLSAKEGQNDVSINYQGFTAGYQAGIGVDLGPFIVDLKYEGNLSRFGKKLDKVSIPVDHRESLFILSVGVNLLGCYAE